MKVNFSTTAISRGKIRFGESEDYDMPSTTEEAFFKTSNEANTQRGKVRADFNNGSITSKDLKTSLDGINVNEQMELMTLEKLDLSLPHNKIITPTADQFIKKVIKPIK